MNPRQLKAAMRKMGMSQTEIPATEVIIKTADKDIVVLNPQVAKVNMMGQDTLQITGQIEEREKQVEKIEISEDDVKTVMEQAKVDKEKAKEVLEETNGDLAEAILKLQE
ncbi:nascent polypeptide-associated complex protein [Nanoarchaeota archaeon]